MAKSKVFTVSENYYTTMWGILSYPHLAEPSRYTETAPLKYSARLLFKKDLTDKNQQLFDAIKQEMLDIAGIKSFSEVDAVAIKDGDDKYEEDNERYASHKDMFYLDSKITSETSKGISMQPKLIDSTDPGNKFVVKDKKDILDTFYAGALVTFKVQPYFVPKKSNKDNDSLGLFLKEVYKVGDGPKLGGSGIDNNVIDTVDLSDLPEFDLDTEVEKELDDAFKSIKTPKKVASASNLLD